jgi:hypothetical protein
MTGPWAACTILGAERIGGRAPQIRSLNGVQSGSKFFHKSHHFIPELHKSKALSESYPKPCSKVLWGDIRDETVKLVLRESASCIKRRSLVRSVLAYAMAYSNSLLTCCLIPVCKGSVNLMMAHLLTILDHYISMYAVVPTSLLLN